MKYSYPYYMKQIRDILGKQYVGASHLNCIIQILWKLRLLVIAMNRVKSLFFAVTTAFLQHKSCYSNMIMFDNAISNVLYKFPLDEKLILHEIM